jgi:phosphoserine aminotransferase
MKRKFNFSAGPSTLPLQVLEEIQREIVDYRGSGMSLIEASHRGAEYEAVHNECIEHIRTLLEVPANYKILLLSGGATLQFGMVPLNLLHYAPEGQAADYVISGAWAKKAHQDAAKLGATHIAYDGASSSYTTLPENMRLSENPVYLHITSNETIGGIRWVEWPDTGAVPLVCDMSSDIMSRPLPIEKFGIIYAGAQKNLGPAGVTVVIIRDDIVQNSPSQLPAYLRYSVHADSNSLYNTPPVFSIFAMNLVLRWVKKQGGVAKMQELAEQKAELIYSAVQASDGFYTSPVDPKYRSLMNVVFQIADASLDSTFIDEATKHGMVGLKGHRSVGGLRASLYNAMPVSGAEALADFMRSFATRRR